MRSTNYNRVTRTYRYDRSALAEIDRLADELEVWPSDLVNLLLTRALAEVQAGRWPLRKQAVKFVPSWAKPDKAP